MRVDCKAARVAVVFAVMAETEKSHREMAAIAVVAAVATVAAMAMAHGPEETAASVVGRVAGGEADRGIELVTVARAR